MDAKVAVTGVTPKAKVKKPSISLLSTEGPTWNCEACLNRVHKKRAGEHTDTCLKRFAEIEACRTREASKDTHTARNLRGD